jgi:hypothetical protein
MPRFYRHMDIRVDIDANSEEEAEQIYQEMDIIAFTRGEPAGKRVLSYKVDYPVDIVNWDNIVRSVA